MAPNGTILDLDRFDTRYDAAALRRGECPRVNAHDTMPYDPMPCNFNVWRVTVMLVKDLRVVAVEHPAP